VELTPRQLDRALGAVMGGAVGDALGAGFEFGPPLADDAEVEPVGGGPFGWGPGSWTDDTQLASAVVLAAAGGDFSVAAVADAFLTWFRAGPVDVGNQTRGALAAATSAADLASGARQYQLAHPDAAGNGSLMRTGPVALTALDDADLVARRADEISTLTHPHPDCVAACILWSLAIRELVTRDHDGPPWQGWVSLLEQGLPWVAEPARSRWRDYLRDGPTRPPRIFAANNGWVVDALRQVVSVLAATPVPAGAAAPGHLADCLRTLVRGGGDTDTVAAIDGALLGAAWGATALPAQWRLDLHGDAPTGASVTRMSGVQLETAARLAVKGGRTDKQGWPGMASLMPRYRMVENARRRTVTVEPGLVFGTVTSLPSVLEGAAAPFTVISLCRVGTADVPLPHRLLPVSLIDNDHDNAHLPFVLADTADVTEHLHLRAKPVFVHCVKAERRTPAVLATFLARHRDQPVGAAIAHAERAFRIQLPPGFRQGVEQAAAL